MSESGELSLTDLRDFERVVQQHRGGVFAICLALLRHREDAEDATQETFSRLFRYRSRFDAGRPIEPYLKRIAGNCCRTFLANRRRRPPAQRLPFDGDGIVGPAAEAAAWGSIVIQEIEASIGDLPANHRRAFIAFHRESRSYAEIADRLGVPEGTIKTWVHRARLRLADQLRRRGLFDEVHRSESGQASIGDGPSQKPNRGKRP